MARLRTLKPDYYLDEGLSEVSLEAHFLLSGLWTIADRAGRLEDRPRRIKVQVFPYREVDVDKALGELAAAGYVVRYEAEGKRLLQVTDWERDQRPHVREPESCLPPPAERYTDHRPSTGPGRATSGRHPGDITALHQPGPLGSGNRDPGIGIVDPSLAGSEARPPVSDNSADDLPEADPEEGAHKPGTNSGPNHSAIPKSSPTRLLQDAWTVLQAQTTDPPKRAPAAKAARKASRKPEEKPPDPRHKPLTDDLCAVFWEITGANYAYTGRSAKTVSLLLVQADCGADTRGEAASQAILKRWRWGLGWRKFGGGKPVQTLEELLANWNKLTRKPPDPEQARLSTTPPTAGATEWNWTSTLPKETAHGS